MAETPNRPLSPHLQVYRPQITSVLSITHRATGIVLSLGTVLLVLWVMAAAAGPDTYAIAQAWAGSWLGYLFLFGYSACLFYHLLNGIRHLFWDAGHGFELETVTRTGWAVLVGTVVLTAMAWILGLSVMGEL
ncbi:MAG: succinate dehydrogenase, cytochrome b556 subunit [Rhodospirillaceae bacterium]|nr:succinate dehydrogenase, cytochrome b556 subunit [Rhodospirillaceae bacterium]|tara:strand:+ start:4098 stop:4496 length:399 start_codon:yes stop_codon:yes gene_type:complete